MRRTIYILWPSWCSAEGVRRTDKIFTVVFHLNILLTSQKQGCLSVREVSALPGYIRQRGMYCSSYPLKTSLFTYLFRNIRITALLVCSHKYININRSCFFLEDSHTQILLSPSFYALVLAHTNIPNIPKNSSCLFGVLDVVAGLSLPGLSKTMAISATPSNPRGLPSALRLVAREKCWHGSTMALPRPSTPSCELVTLLPTTPHWRRSHPNWLLPQGLQGRADGPFGGGLLTYCT